VYRALVKFAKERLGAVGRTEAFLRLCPAQWRCPCGHFFEIESRHGLRL